MKTIPFFLLSLLTLLISCNEKLDVPDKVQIKKSSKHEKVPGTRIFMIKPKGYYFYPRESRIYKSKETFIELQEIPVGYKWKKDDIIKTIESNRSSGLPLYFKKEFKLGKDSAVILFGKGKTPPKDEIVLAFGNDDYMVLAGSEMAVGNAAAREEILSAFISMYVDTTAKPDFRAFADFTVDLAGSPFRFDSYKDNAFYYTLDGKGATYDNPFDTEIMIRQLPGLKNANDLKTWADSLFREQEKDDLNVTNRRERKMVINGMPAYELVYDSTPPGHKVKIYQMMTGNKGTGIYLRAITYDKDIALIPGVAKIAGSIRID